MRTGPAIFLDGERPIRREVTVIVYPGSIEIAAPGGPVLAAWPSAQVRLLEVQAGVTRLVTVGADGQPGPARLEVTDSNLLSAIGLVAQRLDARTPMSRAVVLKIAALSAAAIVSIAAFLWVGIPAAADRLAPLVPVEFERSLGRAVDAQIRLLLDPRRSPDFVCAAPEGRAALERLVARLTRDTAFPVEPRVAVANVRIPNAFALPGGQIYMLRGLLERSETPDEFAAVLAHEMGHVHARHGMRRVLQVGGTSFFVGLLIGDFAGAGVVAAVVQNIASAAYSRDNEREADSFATDLMLAAGGDPRGLGSILTRITRAAGGETNTYFDSHPWTPDRVTAIERQLDGRQPRGPIMPPEDWAALRRICGAR